MIRQRESALHRWSELGRLFGDNCLSPSCCLKTKCYRVLLLFGEVAAVDACLGSLRSVCCNSNEFVGLSVFMTQGRLAQLVRAPSSHGGGHRFESRVAHFS